MWLWRRLKILGISRLHSLGRGGSRAVTHWEAFKRGILVLLIQWDIFCFLNLFLFLSATITLSSISSVQLICNVSFFLKWNLSSKTLASPYFFSFPTRPVRMAASAITPHKHIHFRDLSDRQASRDSSQSCHLSLPQRGQTQSEVTMVGQVAIEQPLRYVKLWQHCGWTKMLKKHCDTTASAPTSLEVKLLSCKKEISKSFISRHLRMTLRARWLSSENRSPHGTPVLCRGENGNGCTCRK